MASILITGASRGLGLALVQELVSLPITQVGTIFATARGDAAALDEIVKKSPGRVVTVKLDVTDQASIKNAVAEVKKVLGDKPLDILINNAGVCHWSFTGITAMDQLEEAFTINTLSAHWVTREFLPLLQKGGLKKVINMSTTLASIGDANYFVTMPCPAYKISKAALNALTVQYALEYAKEGFTFLALSPGWLKTDLGGGDAADLTAEQGAKASLDIVFSKGPESNGQFLKVFVKGWENPPPGRHAYDGKTCPW